MERTWRWFGKKDKITLAQLKQIGVEGIVTHCTMFLWARFGHARRFMSSRSTSSLTA